MRATGLRIALYYASGVLAAAQIGKIAALAPLIQAELHLGLTLMAAVISLLELGGASFGIWAGRLAQRRGMKRSLTAALACLALGSLGSAHAGGAPALIAWRLLEGAGYLGVIVSAPVLIARAAGPATRASALALWSTFVPVGLALGAWGHSALAAATSWRSAMLASSVAATVLCIALASLRRALADVPGAADAPDSGVAGPLGTTTWLLAAAFGGFALFEIGVITLLPSRLVSHAEMSVAAAGNWTAWASMATIAGSLVAAHLAQRQTGHRVAIFVSLMLPALLVFVVFDDRSTAFVAVGAAIVLNAFWGIFGSLAFAMLPAAAGSPQRMAQSYGLLAQFGAAGALLGPPLTAAVVEHWGWLAAAALGLAVSLISLALALAVVQRSERGATH